MCFTDAGISHEQDSRLITPRIVTNEGLRKKLGLLQGLSLLRCVSFPVGEVRDVAFEIAVLIALRNPRAIHHPRRAILNPAIASHRHAPARAIRTRHQLPSRPSAKRAILLRHSDSIRAQGAHGKLSTLGKLWKERAVLLSETAY